MAKLFFHFSAMNAGKTTALLQSRYNYHERGMKTVCFIPDFIADLHGGEIRARVGLAARGVEFCRNFEFDKFITGNKIDVDCILVDEAQFLTKEQVRQLCNIVDEMDIPVLAYGLRTDFQGNLFEGSNYLFAWADKLIEMKTICFCGKKAIMNIRTDGAGRVMTAGEIISPGANECYIPFCRKHYHEAIRNGSLSQQWSFCAA